MDTDSKLGLLAQQIEEARDGEPEDFSLWRQKSEVVLRNILGDANPLYKSFIGIRYSLSVYGTDTPRSAFADARRRGVKAAIAILKAAQTEVELSGGAPDPSRPEIATGSKIFIVHGHDEARKHETARFLRAATGNEPVILHEQASQGRTIIEKFEDHATEAAYAVVIATGDDVGRSVKESQERPRARQNVIFELGFFFGALGRSRVALLYDSEVERPSDIDGLVRVALDSAGAWKLELLREIEAAGVGVDWSALK
ncbi:TIR domain-containing protein [Geodermatophilus nigrescens]